MFLEKAYVSFLPSVCRLPPGQLFRCLPGLSQRLRKSLVLTAMYPLTTLHQWFTFVQLSNDYVISLLTFSPHAHHHRFWLQQLRAVWYRYLITDADGPSIIFSKAPQR